MQGRAWRIPFFEWKRRQSVRNILRKELTLSASPATYFFLVFGLMFFLPGYPVLCSVFFVTLGIFKSFQNAREANDFVFSALLPVAKKDIAAAKKDVQAAKKEVNQGKKDLKEQQNIANKQEDLLKAQKAAEEAAVKAQAAEQKAGEAQEVIESHEEIVVPDAPKPVIPAEPTPVPEPAPVVE